jgi:hypothetical protein
MMIIDSLKEALDRCANEHQKRKETMMLANAFSLNMLQTLSTIQNILITPLTAERVRKILMDGVDSAVGHTDTATIFSTTLGIEIPMIRKTVTLNKGDSVIVGQYRGPRLPEGAKELPTGSTIEWVLVIIS